MKIEIKCRFEGKVLFAFECDNNTIKLTVEAAIKSRANLSGANLSGADLSGAYLSGADLSRADLSRADLSGANLSRANLSGANLSGADLSRAYLSRAYLSGADLSGANLSRADLSGANLSGADLSGANLSGANLSGAYLSGANLSGADLSGANLKDAKESLLAISRTMIIPEEGAFIGFKKICTKEGKKVIKVLIPETAKRVGGTAGRKCRAEFVQMLEDVSGWSDHDSSFKYEYKAGDIVKPDKFDDKITKECTNGIHFFITRAEAEAY